MAQAEETCFRVGGTVATQIENGPAEAADEASFAKSEANTVREALKNRSWPFFEDWSGWQPDPDWPVPLVPCDWDKH